jgi:hypothetical protein
MFIGPYYNLSNYQSIGDLNMINSVRFEVITIMSKNMTVFRVVALCSQKFTDVSKVLAASETPVNFYQTTQCNNPEDSHVHDKSCSQCPTPFNIHFKIILQSCLGLPSGIFPSGFLTKSCLHPPPPHLSYLICSS